MTWLAVGDRHEIARRAGWTQVAVPECFDGRYPQHWQQQEARAARAGEAALRGLGRFNVVHVMHFSRIGLAVLDSVALRDVPIVATLTDYTAICPDHQLWVRRTATSCTPGAASRECLACLDLSESAETDVAAWRARNRVWLNERVRAFWTQTPHQARLLEQGGVSLSRLVSDRARYGLPAHWSDVPTGGDETESAMQTRQEPPEDYALFAGRVSPEKGLHILLDAYRGWPGKLPLRIAALPDDGDYDHQLRAATRDDPRIRWMPPAPRSQLDDVLRHARAVLIPSQWHENHPVIAHEALSMGVPVFCSDVASMRHLADQPGLRLVGEPDRSCSWRSILDQLADTRPPHRSGCIDAARRQFTAFVDDVIAVYDTVRESP